MKHKNIYLIIILAVCFNCSKNTSINKIEDYLEIRDIKADWFSSYDKANRLKGIFYIGDEVTTGNNYLSLYFNQSSKYCYFYSLEYGYEEDNSNKVISNLLCISFYLKEKAILKTLKKYLTDTGIINDIDPKVYSYNELIVTFDDKLFLVDYHENIVFKKLGINNKNAVKLMLLPNHDTVDKVKEYYIKNRNKGKMLFIYNNYMP